MKVFYLLFFIYLLSVDAQRRSVKSELLSENEPPPKTARRGRARFTLTSDPPQIEEKRPDPVSRRLASRRRPEIYTEAPIPKKAYEVSEVIDDTPIESYRKPTKSKVLTETKYEAQNAPPSNALFQPSTTENLDEIIKSIGSDIVDTTFSSVPLPSTSASVLDSSPLELSSSEITKFENEISRSQEITTPSTVKTTKKNNGRSRVQSNATPPTVRVRTRTRVNRRPEEQSTVASRTVIHRGSRRRVEASTTPEPVLNLPSRSRFETRTRAPETQQQPIRSRSENRRTVETEPRRVTSSEVTETPRSRTRGPSVISSAETVELPTRSRSGRRIPNSRNEETTEKTSSDSRRTNVRRVERVRSRSRLTETPPIIDEQKLEVLPLFERESKTVPLPKKTPSEVVDTSASENDLKLTEKPPKQSIVVETRTEATVRRRKPTRAVKSTTAKPTVEATKKPIIKESVVSEISEVTSKRTLTRAKPTSPKFISRGSKKSEINLPSVKKNKSGLSSSEEDIDDSDNYPEPFKALIQAKKQKKESRPALPAITKYPEKVVNPSTTSPVTSSEANRKFEEKARSTRKGKYPRSTTASPKIIKEQRLQSELKPSTIKPPRSVYSSRKAKESFKNKSTTQIPTQKKSASNRYSSRYRSDPSLRGAIRTSTNAPVYVPTIPTITPPTTSVKSSNAYQDKDLGVEVISFDDPVNTVPSANLVNGDFVTSSTESNLINPLVSASQTKTTEKPVSIIERIINSITAISTEVPKTPTTPQPELPTKESAILKLATKKLDKTQTTQKIPSVTTATSENPTTIIERILSSLSAIQADNNTDTKNIQAKQVGSNFNTISSPATTPITRVTKSTLSALLSTTVNPLNVLDEISNEQLLQKRTIDRLLELLKTLTTPSSQNVVVVTPKSSSFVAGTSTTTSTTSTDLSTAEATTLRQLFTSPSAEVRASFPQTTIRYTTTPTYTTLTTTDPTTTTSTQTPTLTTEDATTLPPSTTTTTASTTSSTSSPTTSNDVSARPLSIDLGITTLPTSSSTDSSTTPLTTSESSTQSLDSSTLPTTTPNFAFTSTLPALVNFEVSPESVSVFSANDVSNAITPDDFLSTTVTIPGRTNLPENVVTTQTSTTTTTSANSADNNTTETTPFVSTLLTTTPGGTTLPPSTTTADPTTTQDISSNIIDTTDTPTKSNQTSTANPRSGRLLNIVQEPVQNSLESSTTRSKDFFIFAVLNNNTVLRKRPSPFPSNDTPYLIVGVYPNNTIVRKFPNGTLVPMEPVIRVSGFDTRENPPPLPEITSNQVTPEQGSPKDNKNLQTVEQNTIPPLEANPLSLTNVNNATSSTSSSTTTTIRSTPSSTPSSSTSSTTLPTLTEILNGKTVQAFNSIINISDLNKVQTLEVDPKTTSTPTTTVLPTISNKILEDTFTTFSFPTTPQRITVPITSRITTTVPTTVRRTTTVPTTEWRTTTVPTTVRSTTTVSTTTTPAPTTTPPTTLPSIVPTYPSRIGTTVLPLSQPVTTTYRTTTNFPTTTTFFPQFLTTLFSTLRPRRVSTEVPITIITALSNRVPPTTTTRVELTTERDLISASSTRRSVNEEVILSTIPVSTTSRSSRRRTSRTTTEATTTTTRVTRRTTIPTETTTSSPVRNARRSTTASTTTTSVPTKKLKELTEQQKKDLETLAQLEKEQAAILKQLAFLTNLNFANIQPTTDKNDLANRIIAAAVEREKDRDKTATQPPTTSPPSSTSPPSGKRQAKKISQPSEQSIDDIVKQLNIATPSTITSEYGKSNDAIIAALLKEQGIGPTTPKILEDIYSLTTTTTTTKRPRPTTRRPGPIMQSLNWLLNVLAPPTTTRKPKPKSKKPKPKPKEHHEELLTHQPTRITPVVTPAPRQNLVSSLSQEDIQKLIKQLESIQKDPKNSESLDLSSIKSLQALLNTEEGVKVTSSGTTGTKPRETTPMPTTKRRSKSRVAKSTTALPVSNSIDEDEFVVTTTTRSRVTLPPVRLRPVPGIPDDSETMVRGQLITAAVNVTRAISSFLGTALQGAATSFQSLLGSGSRAVTNLMQISRMRQQEKDE